MKRRRYRVPWRIRLAMLLERPSWWLRRWQARCNARAITRALPFPVETRIARWPDDGSLCVEFVVEDGCHGEKARVIDKVARVMGIFADEVRFVEPDDGDDE